MIKSTAIGGALAGSAAWVPPLAIGLAVGGSLAYMLIRWKQVHELRMMEELTHLAGMDGQIIDAEWAESPA